MNPLAKKYYQVCGLADLQEVIFLCEKNDFLWDELSEKIPDLPKSWYELSRVGGVERKEFVKLLWQDLLPFHPKFSAKISKFFSKVQDVSIVIAKRFGEYFPEMIYSIEDNSTFFIGRPPATFDDVRFFTSKLGFLLPSEYLSFFILHNGFGRLGSLGLLTLDEIDEERQKVRRICTQENLVLDHRGLVVNPQSLIPFYLDVGLNSYQCFYVDWSPTGEIGNVYLSGISGSISDISNSSLWNQELAFLSFFDWLEQYLEGMNFS